MITNKGDPDVDKNVREKQLKETFRENNERNNQLTHKIFYYSAYLLKNFV